MKTAPPLLLTLAEVFLSLLTSVWEGMYLLSMGATGREALWLLVSITDWSTVASVCLRDKGYWELSSLLLDLTAYSPCTPPPVATTSPEDRELTE